jgi:hypothetical protein
MMDFLTAEEMMDILTAEALKLGPEHFGLACLAALSTTNRCWRVRVQAALQEAAPAEAQQLLLQTTCDKDSRFPPVPALKSLMDRARSNADAAALECFATRIISQPGVTMTQAMLWLSAGLQLRDATIYAAARVPLAHPALWVQCHVEMRNSTVSMPLSLMLQALCCGYLAEVSSSCWSE